MITKWVEELARKALAGAIADGELPEAETPPFTVARPKNPDHGDLSVNVALLLAKTAQKPPMAIAEALAKRMEDLSRERPTFSSIEVAKPGFINLRLSPEWLAGQVAVILEQGERFGETDSGKGKSVLIEYVSANPNGPLTLGHGRNGILGDVLARCFAKAGWRAEREFYVNDSHASLQMRLFADSVKARYLGMPLPEDGYKGEYVAEIAAALREKHGDGLADGPPDESRARFHKLAQEEMRAEQEEDIRLYRLSFDRYVSEQSLHDGGAIAEAVELLKKRGHTYEKEGALFLRSTDFGDDKDRPLVRSNGQPTYISADAAYHRDKFERGYDLMIDVLGADHHGYVGRMKAVVAAMGYDPDKLVLLIYQLVRLFRGKEQVRMSTRAGDIIPLRQVLDEVGVDVARFFFLMRSHDSGLDFDLELAKKQSDENPVYYVQYAHARIRSILRKAEADGFSDEGADVSLLTDPAEGRLIKMLLQLPEEVDRVVADLAPHRLTAYAQELAREFHLFYDACRVLDGENRALSAARLALCRATQITLAGCFDLIGISAPERM